MGIPTKWGCLSLIPVESVPACVDYLRMLLLIRAFNLTFARDVMLRRDIFPWQRTVLFDNRQKQDGETAALRVEAPHVAPEGFEDNGREACGGDRPGYTQP